MKPKPYRMAWAAYIRRTTRSPWTRDTKHLEDTRRWTSRDVTPAEKRNSVAIEEPENRIKYWNIVPGDRVRLRNDKKSILHEVYSVNKYANHVFLRGIRTAEDKDDLKPFNYHSLQLFIDHFEFPPERGSDKPKIVPVFVNRWKMSKPVWNGDRFAWTRYALSTLPRLPGLSKQDKLEVPWPDPPQEPDFDPPTLVDTTFDDSKRVTYVPPTPDIILSDDIPDLYLRSFSNPETYDPSLPVEWFLADELSNPHSRAKKQRRWQAKNALYAKIRLEMLDTDLKQARVEGRKRSEARAEAEWKFRQFVKEDKKKEGIRRAVQRGVLVRRERKKRRKARKETARIRRLRETVLLEETNQVLPGTSAAAQQSVSSDFI